VSSGTAVINVTGSDFGSTEVNTIQDRVCTVANQGTADLHISGATLNLDTNIFLIDSRVTKPFTLTENSIKVFHIGFKPKEARKYQGSITFHSNAMLLDSIATFRGEGISSSSVLSTETLAIKIVPNPASDFVSAENIPTSEFSLELIDVLGTTLLRTNTEVMPLQTIASGIYKIRVSFKDSIIQYPIVVSK
jgi:hypothetical protein